jgi:hypothetical protein
MRTLAPDPLYYFSPEGRRWGPDRKLTIAARPNNPVARIEVDGANSTLRAYGAEDVD